MNAAVRLLRVWPCHRIPERCFRIGNEPLPVCARCLGIMVGIPCGIGMVYHGLVTSRLIAATLLLPLLADLWLQHYTPWKGTNSWRFATGLSAGIAASAYLILWLASDIVSWM